MERDFKGVWIPREIWLNEDLSFAEKVLLVEIDSLDKGEGCWASNEYLAKFIGISEGRLANMVSELRKRELIIDRSFDGRKRYISLNPSFTKTLTQPSRKREPSLHENVNEDSKILSEEVSTEPRKWLDPKPSNTSIDTSSNTMHEGLKKPSWSPFKDDVGEEDITVETDEEYTPTKTLKRNEAVAGGYKGHLTLPLLKWAEGKMKRKFTSPMKQKKFISTMLASGYDENKIKAEWERLENDVFWGERGFDFSNVANEIGKQKGNGKPRGGGWGSGHVAEDL